MTEKQPPKTKNSLSTKQVVAFINQTPFYRHLAMKVLSLGRGEASITMPVRDVLMQGLQTVHGGALAALADSAGLVAAWSAKGAEAILTTVEMKINYLSPVKEGTLTAHGKTIHAGNRIQVSEVEIRSDENILVAKALVTSTNIAR